MHYVCSSKSVFNLQRLAKLCWFWQNFRIIINLITLTLDLQWIKVCFLGLSTALFLSKMPQHFDTSPSPTL